MSQESVRVTGILNGAEFFLQPVYFNFDAFLYGGAEPEEGHCTEK